MYTMKEPEYKCRYCGKDLDAVDIAWTWEDLCFDCELKLSET